ncbi:hypothetical protein Pmani_020164 [Petrolisthes manimaculis]|uniref:Uncharacterized protein n=1 Tax=Petrolisthes manimaculis TaxID=1843537 RepID=A0AAE1U6V8_9EUCA|nr:hypothetical protein Pmani_020164 [Petrolisthes manimaculis]
MAPDNHTTTHELHHMSDGSVGEIVDDVSSSPQPQKRTVYVHTVPDVSPHQGMVCTGGGAAGNWRHTYTHTYTFFPNKKRIRREMEERKEERNAGIKRKVREREKRSEVKRKDGNKKKDRREGEKK